MFNKPLCLGRQLMKTVETKISNRLDREIDALVERGWFPTRDEIVQEAIRRFLDAHRPDLMERFVREDVEWGLRGRS
jgi:Arc/MetJ-type ribon-helix-helix transcriptional regulator